MRSLFVLMALAVSGLAADPTILDHPKAKPPDTVSQTIRETLGETALRISHDKQRLTIWLRAEWPSAPKAADASLRPGALVGVMTFTRAWTDFRGQEVPAGAYTLRFARQPASADHEDTSPSRDFLMLSPAALDRDTADLPFPALKKLGGQASGGTHPAVLVLLSPGKREPGLFHPRESWLALQWNWTTSKGDRPMAAILEGVWNGK